MGLIAKIGFNGFGLLYVDSGAIKGMGKEDVSPGVLVECWGLSPRGGGSVGLCSQVP